MNKYKTVAELKQAHPQAVQMKRFLHEQAEFLHLHTTAVFMRIKRGWYPDLVRLRVNKRVVFVTNK